MLIFIKKVSVEVQDFRGFPFSHPNKSVTLGLLEFSSFATVLLNNCPKFHYQTDPYRSLSDFKLSTQVSSYIVARVVV